MVKEVMVLYFEKENNIQMDIYKIIFYIYI
jgi:hypothetical protein